MQTDTDQYCEISGVKLSREKSVTADNKLKSYGDAGNITGLSASIGMLEHIIVEIEMELDEMKNRLQKMRSLV